MKKLFLLLLAVLCLFCACDNDIPDDPIDGEVTSDSKELNVPDNTVAPPQADSVQTSDADPDGEKNDAIVNDVVLNTAGSLYGSYLTMYDGEEETEFPYIKVFDSYAEVDAYFNTADSDFFFGKKFTLALASFDDGFLAENDVMILVISESSSYISHRAKGVTVTSGGVIFDIERHIPEDAPQSSTQYHLIFTAPKGSFDGMEELPFEVNAVDIIDKVSDDTFDAERYRMVYPEFYPFVHRTDATGEAETVVDTINSYAELIGFYERYKSTYDFESEFKKYVGSLYSEDIFEDYVILAIIVPSKSTSKEIAIEELFVYNLEIYLSVENTAPAVVSNETECYLMMTCIAKKDLMGVNLEWFNISFN